MVVMQDSPSFLYRVESTMWKKLFSFGIKLLYSKRMTSILYAHKTAHRFKDLAFSSFKNRITVLLI